MLNDRYSPTIYFDGNMKDITLTFNSKFPQYSI